MSSPDPRNVQLPPPARYLPFLSGRYDVRPGLRQFGADFGNGPADQQVFQIDRDFPVYRDAKLAARQRDLGRCWMMHDYAAPVAAAVTRFMIERLCDEHPQWFSWRDHELTCRLTGEQLHFDDQWELSPHSSPEYVSALDALACQVQEDLAVTVIDGESHWLSALHVCLPSHWDARTKIGRNFADVHEVVPGMGTTSARQDHFVRQMVHATEGLVRFVWGVQRGSRLDRHPDEPPALSQEWFVRVERQTMWGLPEVGASLFMIRPYLIPGAVVRREAAWREPLIAALRGMTDEAARYKGLAADRAELIAWLSAG